jgi:hypothetical protein
MKATEPTTDHSTERWKPETVAERAQVMAQLERLLAHPSFQNSKRYPRLLRYVVEQALAGNEERLKERCLGVEVFERAPDYDTNQDPVVRLSAGEVRKRLALYYQQPEHREEMVIGLHAGSYVPCFQPLLAPIFDARAPVEVGAAVEVDEDAVEDAASGIRLHKALAWGAVGLAFALALAFCWSIVEDPARIFWEPLLHSPSRVTLCAGAPKPYMIAHILSSTLKPGSAQGHALAQLQQETASSVGQMMAGSGQLSLAHVSALIHVGAMLEKHEKPFRVQLDSEATFPELREGPVVLIGAGDNAWTMRLTAPLRYGFVYDDAGKSWTIVDHKNPTAHNWTISMEQPYSSLTRDYAMVARYHDTMIDQPVVIVAGLSSQGTAAASEFLARPEALRELERSVGHDAAKANFQAILETQVIDGHAGPSHVIAVEVW